MPRITTQKLHDTIVKGFADINAKLDGVKPTPNPVPQSNLYVPETQASRWLKSNPLDINYQLIKKIADQPTAEWLGEWSGNIWESVNNYLKKAEDKLAVFIAYNIPGRDNGNYSKGGLHNKDEYWAWIGAMADAIGNRKALVLVEPDAIALATDLDQTKRQERFQMIDGAVSALKKKSNVKVYLDASMWKTPTEMAALLKQCGIDKADGFSVNVSGYQLTSVCEKYANELKAIINKPFIIDTSRNGNGEWEWKKENPGKSFDEVQPWCNPPKRKIGNLPDLSKGYLWLKRPGESDGTCRGGPNAGEFWLEKAIELASN